MFIAKLMYHKWEEEPISGIAKGFSGTFAIFFCGCNLHCIFCQNSKISRINVARLKKNNGDERLVDLQNNDILWTSEKLADKLIEAQASGACSISFITGVFYVDEIAETIKIAKNKGLTIPIVYNSSGYEMVRHIKKLDGLVDIYLPDFKYFDNTLAYICSGVHDYVEIAKDCIAEMYRQIKGDNICTYQDRERQMIVRNLILPNRTKNSMKVIEYLYNTYGDNIYISILSQYTPMLENKELKAYPEFQRKITKREYEKVINYAMDLGVKNAYIQEYGVAKKEYIPEF